MENRHLNWQLKISIELDRARKVLDAAPYDWNDAKEHRQLALKHLISALATFNE